MVIRISLLSVLLIAAHAPAVAAEDTHHHAHDGPASAQLQLNEGKKWDTDGPLKRGMETIKRLLEADLGAIHEGKLSTERYGGLSDKITPEINAIFKNCKLSPKADAMLHLILAQLIEGNRAMKTGASTDRRMGAVKILKALGEYAQYFDHPGWKPIRH
jgi:hypothetical protein